jgi:Asp-tRNA(Asn)/Glu-tRNA(Gln) amidotransferase A subunit family amidase
MVPLVHGTDFGGSVRTPASFCDVVSIRPTPGRIAAPARALGWDMLDYLAVTFIVSLVGFPVLTLPTPRQADQKPFGVQIIAAPGEESKLFAFGRRIEEQLGFCHRPPPI